MKLNRWVHLVIGMIILLLAGMIYAWSVIAVPIAKEFVYWSTAQLATTFTICMIFFCVGSLVSGIVSSKINVKIMLWISALLLFGGFFVASNIFSLTGLYFSYGVLAGLGSGCAYNVVLSTMTKWFPDKQGLISGILLMGFGMGGFIIGKLYQEFTPDLIGGWRISFVVISIIFLCVLAICGFFFATPHSDYEVPVLNDKKKKQYYELDIAPKEMLRRKSFWLFFAWSVLLSATGLSLISQATGIAEQAGGILVSGGTIATVVGLISIFNGIGRIIFGGFFDKFGYKKTLMSINVAFLISVLVLLLSLLLSNFIILVISFICYGLSYGGITPTLSAFINSAYGPTYYSVNFSIIISNLIFSSFGSTISGAIYDATYSYSLVCIFFIFSIIIGTICSIMIKKI